MLYLELTSRNFSDHSDDNWCASVGNSTSHFYNVDLYENTWTDNQHHICQYNGE